MDQEQSLSVSGAPRRSGKLKKSSELRMRDEPGYLWGRPGFLIRRLHQIYCGLFFEDCGPMPITPLQFGMLTVLSEQPDGADIGSLAFQLGTDRSSTADVARRLASRGYIRQQSAKTDRRKVVSRITERGRAFLLRLEPFTYKSQDRLFQPLSPEQRRDLMTILKTLVRAHNDKGRAKLQL